jgi:lactoylglutathione lyase
MRLDRLGHIGINVSDIDRSIDFYRRIMKFKLTGKWGPPEFRANLAFMRLGDKHHDLVLFELPKDIDRADLTTVDSTERRDTGVNHIAFETDSREDWLLAIDHVRNCGVEIVAGPCVHGHESSGPLSFIGGSGSHAFYFLDPDGNRIEVYCWMMKVSQPSASAPSPEL